MNYLRYLRRWKKWRSLQAHPRKAEVQGSAVRASWMLKGAYKWQIRRKQQLLVNVSTTLVDQPIAGVGAAVQIMLKGALNAVTRALAIEYAKEGIRVNTIAPGVINTPMHKPETHNFLKGLHPVGRIGEVKEI